MPNKAYNSAWRRVRLLVLERDEHRCTINMEGCTGAATCVDHIVPLVFGGAPYALENLRASCHNCNTSRSNKLRRKPSRAW
jgi:5-methylcytosine-specific restriction endonuclease McrA